MPAISRDIVGPNALTLLFQWKSSEGFMRVSHLTETKLGRLAVIPTSVGTNWKNTRVHHTKDNQNNDWNKIDPYMPIELRLSAVATAPASASASASSPSSTWQAEHCAADRTSTAIEELGLQDTPHATVILPLTNLQCSK